MGRYLGDDADVTLEVALWSATRVIRVGEQSPLVVELVVWTCTIWSQFWIYHICFDSEIGIHIYEVISQRYQTKVIKGLTWSKTCHTVPEKKKLEFACDIK